jgi:hypothetical protein
MNRAVVPVERIQKAIFSSRGQRVMLDADLAELYGVPTRVLIQSVQRNAARFPDDFMFQLSVDEGLQLEITNCDLELGRLGWAPLIALRVHRARGRDAVERASKPSRDRNQYRDHASVRTDAADAHVKRARENSRQPEGPCRHRRLQSAPVAVAPEDITPCASLPLWRASGALPIEAL